MFLGEFCCVISLLIADNLFNLCMP